MRCPIPWCASSLGEALKDKDLEAINLSWPEAAAASGGGAGLPLQRRDRGGPGVHRRGLPGPEVGGAGSGGRLTPRWTSRLEEIRQHNALLKPPAEERGIQEGDFVVLDYQGYFAGEPAEGAKAEGTYMEVGSGKFNAEFETQPPGPQGRGGSPLRGGPAQRFRQSPHCRQGDRIPVKIQEVKEKMVAELDDTFAQNLGGNFQTLADLRSGRARGYH